MKTFTDSYEDRECIDAFLESRDAEITEWQEENLEVGMGVQNPKEYLYQHSHAFDDFAYNYYEDRIEGEAERRRELREDC